MSETLESLKYVSDVEVSRRDSSISEVRRRKPWYHYLWDTFDKSPEERLFLFKLDGFLLTFASVGYFLKYLDQANINNAYVSGMKEDLGLYGNQLNYMQTCWTVGYVVGQLPFNYCLARFRPSYLIPAIEFTWAIMTLGMAWAPNAKTVYALRFFIGFAEAGFYPGMQYLIGCWYRQEELAKRACIFHTSSSSATMISGYLQAAVYRTLNGRNGLAGWRWLFIIDGVISAPIALLGLLAFPDTPETTRALYFSKRDIDIAQRRMRAEGRGGRGKLTWANVRKLVQDPKVYALVSLYVTFNNGCGIGSSSTMALWLKSLKYSVSDVNVYPTGMYAITIVTTLIYAWSSDGFLKGRRWPPIIFAGIMNIIACSMLLGWDNIPFSAHFAAYYLGGFIGGISGLIMSWGNEIYGYDNGSRAIVLALMNDIAYVFQAWLPLVIFPQLEAPRFKKGFIGTIIINLLMFIALAAVYWLHRRTKRQDSIVISQSDPIEGSIETASSEESSHDIAIK